MSPVSSFATAVATLPDLPNFSNSRGSPISTISTIISTFPCLTCKSLIAISLRIRAAYIKFEKFGRSGRVATAVAKDETGDIKLTLWNDQIDQVKAGDKVHITNGYVSEWQGEKQLTTGKMGKLEVV